MLQDFNARNVPPQQGVGGHPPGIFPFQITNTYLKENSAKTGAMLVVELTSDVGKIENRYNVINPNAKAVEIAQKELSALCHAVNIYDVAFPKNPDGSPIMDRAGFTLRGGRGRMEIVPQLNSDGTPNGYMEVKKVFDMQGNEPGKAPMQQQPQTMQQPAPMQQAPIQQQPNGSWATPAQQPNGGQQPQQAPMQQAPQQNAPAPGWAQQPQGGNPPPAWAK